MRSFLYLMIFVSGLLLFFFAARAKNRDDLSPVSGKKRDALDTMARYLYHCIRLRILSADSHSLLLKALLGTPRVQQDLRALNPEQKIEVTCSEYYVQKIKRLLLFLYLGAALAFCIHMSSLTTGSLMQENCISKKEYGEGEQQIYVRLETMDGRHTEEMQLVIDERVYTPEELDAFYEKAVSQLEKIILADNAGTEEVKSSLYLPDALPGYPFDLEWESSDCFLMSHTGAIQKEKMDTAGEAVTLTCHLSYRDWERDYQLPLLLLQPDQTEEERWREQVEQTLTQSREKQLYEASYTLPQEIGGRKVSWKEQIQDYSISLFVLLLVTGCGVYFLQDRDLHKKLEERNQQMLSEYPALVNRLTLYLGAGMTVKAAWNKIALDYRAGRKKEQEKHYTYEEMLLAGYEMQSGVSESRAYEHFGKRCGLQPYTRLVGLLNQSLKKGNAELLKDLQKEAADAQEERRSQARKKGEEAGTKLLMPMMMMLGIVMVLIMIPAFLSFSM